MPRESDLDPQYTIISHNRDIDKASLALVLWLPLDIWFYDSCTLPYIETTCVAREDGVCATRRLSVDHKAVADQVNFCRDLG